MTNQELYDKAVKAITDLYDDQSVSIVKAIFNLRALQGEINIFIDALKSDLEME